MIQHLLLLAFTIVGLFTCTFGTFVRLFTCPFGTFLGLFTCTLGTFVGLFTSTFGTLSKRENPTSFSEHAGVSRAEDRIVAEYGKNSDCVCVSVNA
mmetsp:Transcript_19883/g.63806  ORF Transcript_19883/g.63806 Transcript_19883/m.63806 type:complete len:96 (-) Transcript_19883:1764-2051(-)